MLSTPDSAPIVDPLSLTIDAKGVGYLADKSEKTITVFSSDGSFKQSVGGVGTGAGKLITLFGSGRLRDSLVAYDFNSASIEVFGPTGEWARRTAMSSDLEGRIRTLRSVDDSLLLLVRYPMGAVDEPLVWLTNATLRPRTKLYGRRTYYERVPNILRGISLPRADASFGLVAVSTVGDDTLAVFGYDGREIARGSFANRAMPTFANFEDLIRANGGSAFRRVGVADSALVAKDAMAVASVVVLSADYVAVGISDQPKGRLMRADFADSSYVTIGRVDRATRQVHFSTPIRVAGSLAGRGPDGKALIVTAPERRGTTVEISHVGVSTVSGGGRCG
jgi:hypothetical protein